MHLKEIFVKGCLEVERPTYFMETEIDKILQGTETDDLIKVASQTHW